MIRLLGALALAVWAGPAIAQNCLPRADFLSLLQGQFAEVPVAHGLGGRARMLLIELHTSDTGSWTVTATAPDGITCLIASEEAWEAVSPPPAGEPG